MGNWSDWIRLEDIYDIYSYMEDFEYGDNIVQFKDIDGNIIDGNIDKEEYYSEEYDHVWDDLHIDKPDPIPNNIQYVRYLLSD